MNRDFPLKDYYGDIHATYDRINRIFTFGRDRAWRRKAVDACLGAEPDRILLQVGPSTVSMHDEIFVD